MLLQVIDEGCPKQGLLLPVPVAGQFTPERDRFLASGRVEFLDGNARLVRLDQPNQVITFRVEFKAAGPSNIDVFVTSPNGAIVSRSELVVRSTAVNPIALIITGGAGLVLVGLWSRRLFRRRNR